MALTLASGLAKLGVSTQYPDTADILLIVLKSPNFDSYLGLHLNLNTN